MFKLRKKIKALENTIEKMDKKIRDLETKQNYPPKFSISSVIGDYMIVDIYVDRSDDGSKFSYIYSLLPMNISGGVKMKKITELELIKIKEGKK
jgi:hypothetical protein